MILMPEKKVLARGLVEKIGLNSSRIKHRVLNETEMIMDLSVPDHTTGIRLVFEQLTNPSYGVVDDISEIDAVGHRVVHGGEDFIGSVPITAEVIKALEKNIDLAPLHNPPNLAGIYAINQLLPDVPQAGVFDTAFHQSMPPYAYLYAFPYRLYEKYKVRKYGFHGTSHKYVANHACMILKKDINNSRIITCHLGNGSSIAAIRNGKSIETSMGLTPNEGLIMGTRLGDIDAGALLFIADKEKLSIPQTNALINKESGVLGISGISSDMRELEKAAESGNQRAQLALDMFHHRIRKFIGAYAAVLGGVDILVFTGGIGENADQSRAAICKDFEYLGLNFDPDVNKGLRSKEAVISKDYSKVTVMVVPTDEELAIAMDTHDIVHSSKSEV